MCIFRWPQAGHVRLMIGSIPGRGNWNQIRITGTSLVVSVSFTNTITTGSVPVFIAFSQITQILERLRFRYVTNPVEAVYP